jgi:hypothetical protein
MISAPEGPLSPPNITLPVGWGERQGTSIEHAVDIIVTVALPL